MDCHIRWMIRRDMPEVLEIESHSFRYPWSEDDFFRCLRQRNCIGMVVETQVKCSVCAGHSRRCGKKTGCHGTGLEDDAVVGYMIYELHKYRLTLLSLAVHLEWRNLGVGRQMIEKVKGKLSPQRRRQLTMLVAESNLDGQLFLRSQGFKAVGITADVFEGPGDYANGIDMRFTVPQPVMA